MKTMLKRGAMLLWLVGVLSCGKAPVEHGRNQAYALEDGGRAVVSEDGQTLFSMSSSGVLLRLSLHPTIVTQATLSNLR